MTKPGNNQYTHTTASSNEESSDQTKIKQLEERVQRLESSGRRIERLVETLSALVTKIKRKAKNSVGETKTTKL